MSQPFPVALPILRSGGWTVLEYEYEMARIRAAVLLAAESKNTNIVYHLTDKTRAILCYLMSALSAERYAVVRANICMDVAGGGGLCLNCPHNAVKETCRGKDVLIISWEMCNCSGSN
jgi:hypothetical protein